MNGTGCTMNNYEQSSGISLLMFRNIFHFGFDIIDAWAKKDRNKPAMIWVSQKCEERNTQTSRTKRQTYSYNFGINKGDQVLVMPPRIPE
jgi:acetyl-CoA synthetase